MSAAFAAIRAYGLGFREAGDFPWGHTAWLGDEEERSGVTVNPPASRDFAELFDFASPAGYALGKSGWISCHFAPGEEPDPDLTKRWLVESYSAVAPKRLGALLSVVE